MDGANEMTLIDRSNLIDWNHSDGYIDMDYSMRNMNDGYIELGYWKYGAKWVNISTGSVYDLEEAKICQNFYYSDGNERMTFTLDANICSPSPGVMHTRLNPSGICTSDPNCFFEASDFVSCTDLVNKLNDGDFSALMVWKGLPEEDSQISQEEWLKLIT